MASGYHMGQHGLETKGDNQERDDCTLTGAPTALSQASSHCVSCETDVNPHFAEEKTKAQRV